MEISDKKIDILGVKIDNTNPASACNTVQDWVSKKKKAYVCVAPVSTIVECQDNKEYLDVVNNADMVTPDGMPVVWIGKLRGCKTLERTYGPDLMLDVCQAGQPQGYRHYFYGGLPETCEMLSSKLSERFPKISIVGKYSPPFRELSAEEDEKVVRDINQAQPDVLWVGLGSPKQDFWMTKHRDKLDVPVMIGVGAAFDFLSGRKKQAPSWMQRAGLEWFFRLVSEPRRLWKRYFIGNSKFIFLMLKESMQKGFKGK